MGSNSKFTPEIRGALLERIAAGVSLADAAKAAGVSVKTVKGWLARGRKEGDGGYAEFAAAVEQVRADLAARPQPMDEDELRLVVSKAARRGSVQAMKLCWEMLRAAQGEDEDQATDPLDQLDEVARKRSARKAA